MDKQIEEIISNTKINTSLFLIKNYLDVLTSFNDAGVSRNDILGFESSFETNSITSVMDIKGFSESKTKLSSDVAMEGVLNTVLEERVVYVREYFDTIQGLMNSNKVIYNTFRNKRQVGEIKNHPVTAKLRNYSDVFNKEWDAIIERNPSVMAVLTESNSTQNLLIVQIEKALKSLETCKDALYDFLAKPIQRNQAEVELKHHNAYKEIALYLEMEVNLNFANFTKEEYTVSGTEISLQKPLSFSGTSFMHNQNSFIEEMKELGREKELTSIPFVNIDKLPSVDLVHEQITPIETHHDVITNLLKSTRKELVKDNTEIKRLIVKENNDFIVERDVVELNVKFTDEMLKVIRVLVESFVEIEKVKVSIAHTILELKTAETKL